MNQVLGTCETVQKKTNIRITGVTERGKKDETEKIVKEVMAENSPNLTIQL